MQGRSYRATWHPGPVPGCAATEEACRVGAEGYSLSLDDLQECCLSNPHGDFTGGPVVKNPPCNTEGSGIFLLVPDILPGDLHMVGDHLGDHQKLTE